MTDFRLLMPLCLVLTLPAVAADQPASAAAPAVSPAEAMDIPERSQPKPAAHLKQTLKQQPPQGSEPVQLNAGESSLLGFYQPAEQPEPLGGVIIFPDRNTHPDWPQHTRRLRSGLAQHGWHTLSLYLPPPAPQPLPKRTLPVLSEITSDARPAQASTALPASSTAIASTEQPPEETTANPYPQMMRDYASAAIRHLQQTGIERILLLGVGNGATWAADAMIAQADQSDFRLILLDARQSNAEQAPRLMELLPDIANTTLDLYHPALAKLTPRLEASVDDRARLVRTLGLAGYYQRRLPYQVSPQASDDRLLKALRGALHSLIVKPELDNRPVTPLPAEKQQAAPGTPTNAGRERS